MQRRVFLRVGATPIERVMGTCCVDINHMIGRSHSSIVSACPNRNPSLLFRWFFHSKMSSYLRVLASLRDLCFELVVVGYVKAVLEIKHSVF